MNVLERVRGSGSAMGTGCLGMQPGLVDGWMEFPPLGKPCLIRVQGKIELGRGDRF
jgi:hypothetical protein